MLPFVVFFDIQSPDEFPFSVKRYRDSYRKLSTIADSQHLDLRFVFSRSDISDDPHTFLSYWKWKDDQLTEIRERFVASVIMNKSRYRFPGETNTLNSHLFEDIGQNKLLTNQLFPAMVKTYFPLLPQYSSYISSSIETEKVIIKPVTGTGGTGITIRQKDEVLRNITQYQNDLYLVQELIDGSQGIHDLVEGNHDLRIIIFQSEPKLGYIRTPAPDSVLSNLAQGGSADPVELEDVPNSVMNLVEDCISTLKPLGGWFYSIDFMMEDSKPYLIEINDQPGLPSPALGAYTDRFLHFFLDIMRSKMHTSQSDKAA